MPREIEKQLMTELERVLKDQDAAQGGADEAKAAYEDAARTLARSHEEVKALAGAIAALRGQKPDFASPKIVQEARENAGRRPVA
jgi:hypothetical protein